MAEFLLFLNKKYFTKHIACMDNLMAVKQADGSEKIYTFEYKKFAVVLHIYIGSVKKE